MKKTKAKQSEIKRILSRDPVMKRWKPFRSFACRYLWESIDAK